MEEKLKLLKEALKGNDAGAIQRAMEELTKVSHKLAEEVYKASAARGGAEAGPQAAGSGNGREQPEPEGPGDKKEGVIDAEFKVDDDKKK